MPVGVPGASALALAAAGAPLPPCLRQASSWRFTWARRARISPRGASRLVSRQLAGTLGQPRSNTEASATG